MIIEYIVAHYTCRHHTFCASAGTTRGIINHPAAFHHMICRSHCIRHAILMILAMSNEPAITSLHKWLLSSLQDSEVSAALPLGC